MERVKNILQKLQEMYYAKHQKSAIDLDLMLDYTRVMYADLLEWRGAFKEEPPTAEAAEPNEPVTETKSVTAKEQELLQAEPQPEADAAVPEEEVKNAPEHAELPAEPAVPVSEMPEDKSFRPIERDEPAPKEPEAESEKVVVITPEKEYIDALQRDASGISFEPPSAPEHRTEIKEELLIEEPAVPQAIAEKPAPPPVAIPLPDMVPAQEQPKPQAANLFSAVKAPKDIRSAIGINDKYLFLNELFNNHKSNYEETLDKLNHFATGDQAEDWIRTKVAPAHKWDQEDATVTSFYTLVKRHFSER
jgi:hypothetical protein